MDSTVKRGRIIVIFIICSILGTSLFTILSYNMSIGSNKLISQVIRFLLSCLLCFFIYKGFNWAKWITAILMLFAALISLFGILGAVYNPFLVLTLFVYMVIYGMCGIVLLASKSVKEFMFYNRG